MVANLTTPLIGVVSTIAIGRLGDATLLGGVAITSVVFDCLFWLFSFLRTSTVAFTAQALGAGETLELRAIFVRGLVVAGLIGAALIVLQLPLAAMLLGAMGGSEGVTRAARTYFIIRIWSAPLALANYVVLGWLIGQARARLALAVQIDPFSSAAYELWSEIERVKGDTATADRLHAKAWATADSFENYAEVAALYFRLAWKKDQKLTRSPFDTSGRIRFN